jgi:CubicO group peptidase (beta-lactamase class C family)
MKYIPAFFFVMIIESAFAQTEKRLDSLLRNIVGTGEPGIALYVESAGKVIYNKGFGLADSHANTKIKTNTNFRLASVSKQFTAMGLLLLEKENKISFDDPVNRYLPELPSGIGSKVLIRHLITHSSGIIDYEEIMDNSAGIQLLDADVLNLLKKDDKTYFTPGSNFRYSNSAYALMALIIERISGQSYPQFIKERVFKPLKMNHSLIYEKETPVSNRAMGFARDKNQSLYANDQSSTSAVKGDGGVYTSLQDYKKWTHAIWNNTLIDMQQALSELNFSIKELTQSYYGPGWFYFTKGEPALFHSGSTCGFSTFSVNIPRKKTSIVYLSNIAGNTEPFRKILNVLAEEGINNPSEIFELHQLTR